jgi:hypothetical protein
LRQYALDRVADVSTTRPSRSDGSLAARGHFHVVGDDDDGRSEAGVDVANQGQDLFACAGVEIPGRLVGEEDRRVDRQGARDGDALALAAGELVGEMLKPVFELDEAEKLARAVVDVLARPAAQVQRQADVLDRGERRQQVEELEDEAILSRRIRVNVVGQALSASPSVTTGEWAVESADG